MAWARVRTVQEAPGRVVEADFEIVEWAPPARLAERSVDSPLDVRVRFDLAPSRRAWR